MLRAKKLSRKASRALTTRMQQAVQHLNKSGGMAGTMADEKSEDKDPHLTNAI